MSGEVHNVVCMLAFWFDNSSNVSCQEPFKRRSAAKFSESVVIGSGEIL